MPLYLMDSRLRGNDGKVGSAAFPDAHYLGRSDSKKPKIRSYDFFI